ncbi:MAG: GxxExxY protein [Dehalococcoidia bacterium]|nr:GxxExxY protein [Dehalococcoidia bacterium]
MDGVCPLWKPADAVVGAATVGRRRSVSGCLCFELGERGLSFCRQLEVPLVYKGRKLASNLRIDVLVEHTVVVG